eukprot:gene10863-biopygen8064
MRRLTPARIGWADVIPARAKAGVSFLLAVEDIDRLRRYLIVMSDQRHQLR